VSISYFDASALSRACIDAEDRNTCRKAFSGADHRLFVSEFNIRELVATSEPNKRAALLGFASELTSGFNVVASPNILLRRTAAAFQAGQPEFNASLNAPVAGFIQTLQEAGSEESILLEDARRKNHALNETFKAAGARARSAMNEQGLGKALGTNGARFTKSVLTNEDEAAFARFWIQSMLEPGSPQLLVADVLRIPEWRCFLVSFCLHFFDKTMRVQKFGKTHRPEASDVLQAIYLARATFYVVADRNHYLHARRVSRLVRTAWTDPVAEVLTYERFFQMFRSHTIPASTPGNPELQ
jgi:hypothetical protein